MTYQILSTFAVTSPTVAVFGDGYKTEVVRWAIAQEVDEPPFPEIIGIVRSFHDDPSDPKSTWGLELAKEATNFIGYRDGK